MMNHQQRMLVRYGLSYSTSLYSQVLFDPIFTPLFTAIFSGGLGLTGTALSVAVTASSAIATTALAIGVQALMAPKVPDPESGRVPKTQSVPFRIWAVGRTRLAGAYMMWEASGDYLYATQALVAHRSKSINRYWLHNDEVFIDASGYTTNDDNGRYGNNVRLLTRLGLPTETPYAPLVDKLAASGVWTNNHRGDGQTSLAMIAESTAAKNQNKRFPYGAPQASVEGDWAICWDFRIDANPDNPAAWVWTQNSVLILCWHECFNEFGNLRDYRIAILPLLDMWIEEANICDEDVPRASGGSEKRYECNGWDTTENGPKVGSKAILATCDGWTMERPDGALLLTIGKFRESRVETITDDDIIGHRIQFDVLFEEETNRLVPKFTYPDTGYSTCDTDYFEDTAAQMSSGRVLSKDGEYLWCHQWRQARRLGKREWLCLQEKPRGQIDCRFSGVNAAYSRWVRLDTPIMLPELNGKIVENKNADLSILNGVFTMDIAQYPADTIDNWNPDTDEGKQPPVPNTLGTAEISPGVINTVQAKANGGSVYLRVVLVDPGSNSWTPVVFYRLTDAGGGTPGAWIEQQFPDWTASGGFIELNTGAVPVDVDLDVEAGYIGSNGSYGPRSPTEEVHTTADPTSAGPVTGVSVSPGTGNATINWTAPNSSNYAAARIFWNTVNNFATASAVSPPTNGAPNAFSTATITLAAGVKYAWVVSLNRSGVEGTPVATGAFTVA